jgi:hypothetical protein
MGIDINLLGAELSLRIEDLLDEIRSFLIDTDNNLIGYNSNIPKDDSELTDSERKRITAIDAEVPGLQQQINDMSPDPAIIKTLSDEIVRLTADLVNLFVQKSIAQQELIEAVKNADGNKQNQLLNQINAIDTNIKNKQQAISDKQILLGIELNKKPDPQKLGNLIVKIANLLAEKNRILCLRPAALSIALDNLGKVLSTINQVEQPKIDTILDHVAETLLDVNTILKKIHDNEQPLVDTILVEVPGTIASMRDVIGRVNAIEQPKIEDIMDSLDDTIDDTDEILRQVKSLFAIKSVEFIDPSNLPPDLKGKLADLTKEQEVLGQRIQKQQNAISKIKETMQNMPGVPGSPFMTGQVLAAGTVAKDSKSPVTDTEKFSNVLGSQYDNQNAYLKQMEREREKIGENINQIKTKIVEKPGIIPKILDSTHESLEDTHNILGKINDALGQGLGCADKYNLLIKIGLVIFGVAFTITVILIPILLIRMILFGL